MDGSCSRFLQSRNRKRVTDNKRVILFSTQGEVEGPGNDGDFNLSLCVDEVRRLLS